MIDRINYESTNGESTVTVEERGKVIEVFRGDKDIAKIVYSNLAKMVEPEKLKNSKRIKVVHKEFSDCSNCPYLLPIAYYPCDIFYVCPEKKRIITDLFSLPEDCPLEDKL